MNERSEDPFMDASPISGSLMVKPRRSHGMSPEAKTDERPRLIRPAETFDVLGSGDLFICHDFWLRDPPYYRCGATRALLSVLAEQRLEHPVAPLLELPKGKLLPNWLICINCLMSLLEVSPQRGSSASLVDHAGLL